MPEKLYTVNTLTSRRGTGSTTLSIPPEASEALGGEGAKVAIVGESGKIFLVPASEVSLL